MHYIPTDVDSKKTKKDLLDFLKQCQKIALKKNHFQIVSISLEVKYIDPLAVLESIYEPHQLHFYLENPQNEQAIAGAEAIIQASFEGPDRFSKCISFSNEILENSILTGTLNKPFTGLHFFTTFTFFDTLENHHDDICFPPACIFVPCWQVARDKEHYSAVANVKVDPHSNLEFLTSRIWAAHEKFQNFDYNTINSESTHTSQQYELQEVGGNHWYQNSVKQALDLIDNKKFEKIVLARATELHQNKPFKPLETLNRIRQKYPTCFSCSVGNGKNQSFISATPERLVKIYNKKLFTEALAGSAPRGTSAKEDAYLGRLLLESKKDLQEHQFVIDYILNKLQSLKLAPNKPDKPRIKQLANVQHLFTPIEAMTFNDPILSVVERLHPTPAVGGIPLNNALESIRDIENFNRGLYAGAIGWFDYQNNGEYIVGIRSALIKNTSARLYAGGGIVQGSNPETEQNETDIKLQAMLDNLR